MSTSGEQLYELVRTYAGLGWHRTGSDVDARTATWFADELSRRGLAVSVEGVPFDRWTAESRLLGGGDLPLLTDAWQHLCVPMLSMSGAGIDFHTPHDTPERATSPHALILAADAIAAATDRFPTSLPAR